MEMVWMFREGKHPLTLPGIDLRLVGSPTPYSGQYVQYDIPHPRRRIREKVLQIFTEELYLCQELA
jgi:hypothetical protein